MGDEQCSWCAAAVGTDDGYRAFERSEQRRAVFCRLEHVVPWVIRGAHWPPAPVASDEPPDDLEPDCALCGEALSDSRVVLVRHRGEHRIADGFCSIDHLREWAHAGGRWA